MSTEPSVGSHTALNLPADSAFISLDQLAYANGAPAISATIKQEIQDFQVDEELGFEFTGDGEHLYLQIRKSDCSTPDVARRLSDVTGVPLSDIGYAGMKDRRGECSQWFSVQISENEAHRLTSAEDASLSILQSQRNSRKLKIGSHKLNHFRLRLRDCDGAPELFESRLQALRSGGIPNYFGAQRFGREMSNLVQVQALMSQVLSEPDPQAISRLLKQRGVKRGMLYSAARAYLFNQVLSARVTAGSWNAYVPGDVLNLAGTDRCFAVAAGQWDEKLQNRLQEFDIHLTGPLAGQIDPKDKYISRAQAADIEEAVLQQFTTLLRGLERCGLMAARRPLRFVPLHLEWEWEAAGILQLRFALSRGSYATSLLRELCQLNPH